MIEYSVETLVFENGERYPILMGSDEMPHFRVTLWVTNKLRAVGKQASTISNKLEHVKWFLQWEAENQRDLYLEFQKGRYLDTDDIQSIKSHLAIDLIELKSAKKAKSSGRNKIISIADNPKLVDVVPSVGRNHHYNRMTSVIEYLDFIAKLAIQKSTTPSLNNKIEKMKKMFKAARPKGKGKNVLDNTEDKTLPEELVREFMSVAHYDNPKNPFKKEEIRFRNHLMFLLLEKHGIRAGELLSLKLTHMTLHGSNKSFWVRRTHDDAYDSRKNQRVAKTKERKLKISDTTAELLDRYILEYRKNTNNTKKHSYLFVVHRKGDTEGQPLSGSTFDNTIVPAMKAVDAKFSDIHPHYFRHDWNEGFSQKIDAINDRAAAGEKGVKPIDSGKEAKMRMHQMGHSSEKSGEVYNQRHITKTANEFNIQEQEELAALAAEERNCSNNAGEANE
jgi:integrase